MHDGSAKGFWLSVALHGAVAVALFLGFVLKSEEPEPVKIFELVAGEGDNFMAREAPALGTEGGVKMDIPQPPTPKSAPPEPVAQEFSPPPSTPPPQPTPKTVTPPPTKATEQTVPNFKKQIAMQAIKGESRAKRDIAKEKAAEKKRLEEEAKKEKLTKEEFDRKNKAKTVASATPTKSGAKAPKIDVEGIKQGVTGGSTANKVGGAGGKALTAEEGNELERYQSALLTRLKEALDRTPGLEDALRAEAEFSITDSGRLVNGRITKSSKNEAFDKAVLDAIASTSMGYRPKGMPSTLIVPFTTHDRNRG
jgi:colicin import membrane protein